MNWAPKPRAPRVTRQDAEACRVRKPAPKLPRLAGETHAEHVQRILMRAGAVVPGHPDWRTPEEVEAWAAKERGEFPAVSEHVEAIDHASACRFIGLCEKGTANVG